METKVLTIKDKINLINDLKGDLRKDLNNYFTTRLKNELNNGYGEIELKKCNIETSLFSCDDNKTFSYDAISLFYDDETNEVILVIENEYGDESSANINDYELDVMIDIYNHISK